MTFSDSYIVTALWASSDKHERSMSDRFAFQHIAPDTMARLKADAEKFEVENREWFDSGTHDAAQAGHDFWLTRNRHGAGFWDGHWPTAVGKHLTAAAHAFGEFTLYEGDDGMIHGS